MDKGTISSGAIGDDVNVEVKGPGPEWAKRDEQLKSAGLYEEPPLEIGEIRRTGLDEKSVEDLRSMASEQGVEGRSSMAKDDLAQALYDLGVGVIKGPGPQWETDENGRYVNRG
ncbi:MAG: Rho termination factor N-terminal domain-containing protein [Actinomycetota bacterium]|nr:Rho termination factor N-terminal domain-containing protein [Actinomycetota bacterium]